MIERFPKLTLSLGAWREEPLPAEEALSEVDLGRAEAVYFLGVGRGEGYRLLKGWLREDPKRRLIFLERKGGRLPPFLKLPEAEEIFSDPQVHLEVLFDLRELKRVVEQFSFERFEVLSLPSYRGFRFEAIKLALLRFSTLHIARRTDRLHGYQHFGQWLQNIRHLPTSFYANRLRGAFQGVPAIVCGAGPSLAHGIETLRTLENQALLIAGGSTISALSAKGITPHFGLAIDPNLEEYRRLKESSAFEMPLLYSTRLFPAVFHTASGPFGYLRSGIGGLLEVWLEEELSLLEPLIGEKLPEESLSVTMVAVAWAQYLGCSPILFHGLDLAYTGGKRYAPGIASHSDSPLSLMEQEKVASDRILNLRDREGKSTQTATRWVMEAASLSAYAKAHPEHTFYNTTEGGLPLQGIPYLPLAEAADKLLTQRWDLKGWVLKEVSQASFPKGIEEKIREKVRELAESLDRLVAHLEILAGGAPSGRKALAEIELFEEMASWLLFYDIKKLLAPLSEHWGDFLTLALKYQRVLKNLSS